MQKLALGALVGFLVACGGGSDSKIHIVDAAAGSGSGSDAACNPLTQTGCNTGEMCTWIYDLVSADGTNILGHVGCAPDGTKAVAASCTRNAAGAQGWDDCAKGGFCRVRRELVGPGGTGVCEAICDNNGGTPGCGSDAACVAYHGIFDVSGTNVAGVCDVKCDPFADNDFLHAGSGAPSRPGTKCQAYEGCYGFPNRVSQTTPTKFSCAREYNTDLHNRDACTATSGNSLTSSNPLTRVACSTASNGCSEGYMPVLIEMTGSMIAVCTAMCKPADCYTGHCGGNTQLTTNLTGLPGSGHRCEATDILASSGFLPATPGPSGMNLTGCTFNWSFEVDMQGVYYPSPFSDTLGWCEAHDQYKYDSNGDGMLTDADQSIPKCDTIVTAGYGTHMKAADGSCTATNLCLGAADFGCVSKATAGPAPAFQVSHGVLMNRPQSAVGVRAAQ
jgi:hypothetical protein